MEALSLPSVHKNRCLLHPFSSPISKPSKSKISASISPTIDISPAKSTQALSPDQNYLSGSTRTVTTLFPIAIAATKLFAHKNFILVVQLKEPLLSAAGPSFFAAIKDAPSWSLNTPLTVVAAGMEKWLDLYSGVLMVRVTGPHTDGDFGARVSRSTRKYVRLKILSNHQIMRSVVDTLSEK